MFLTNTPSCLIAKGKNEKKQIAAKSRRWSDETKKKMSEIRKRRFVEDPAYKAKILCKLKQFSGENQGRQAESV